MKIRCRAVCSAQCAQQRLRANLDKEPTTLGEELVQALGKMDWLAGMVTPFSGRKAVTYRQKFTTPGGDKGQLQGLIIKLTRGLRQLIQDRLHQP